MRFKTFVILFFCLNVWQAHASHNRAGEIFYEYIGDNTFKATAIIFTDPGGVDEDQWLIFHWGDGDVDTIPRVSLELVNSAVERSVYEGSHTYSSYGWFKLSTKDLNRVNDILNINYGNSVDIPFYLEDSLLFLDPAVWSTPNNSVVTTSHAVDTAYFDEVYFHNMGAYDPDGIDSLRYEFYTPLQDWNTPVPNYTTLDALATGSTLSVDPITGLVTWDKPHQIGLVNIGIVLREFRRYYNTDGSLLTIKEVGNVKRDLQIFILDNAVSTGVHEDAVAFDIGPNPSHDVVVCSWRGVEVSVVELYDSFARNVLRTKPSGSQVALETSAFPSGVYTIRMVMHDGNVAFRKLAVH